MERKKCLPSPFSLRQPRELQAVEGRCVTPAAAVTDCNPEDEEMVSEASFLCITLPQGENLADELENSHN